SNNINSNNINSNNINSNNINSNNINSNNINSNNKSININLSNERNNISENNENNQKNIDTVKITVAKDGKEFRLIRMAEQNAEIIKKQKNKVQNAMIELKKYLKLKKLPRIIEGYDVSNISGQMAVGSKVSFLDSKPNKNQYRRFKLKTPGPDDYAMMEELLSRRFESLKNHLNEDENYIKPDLILIDGGKGQLKIAMDVLKKYDLNDIPVIGLAKAEEEVFIPKVPFPIIIPKNNEGLHLLQRVRDEAHRFGVTYHRKLRSKTIKYSELDNIEGIGEKRKINLLKHFGDIESIKNADIEEITMVKGMNKKIAKNVYNYFNPKN
ncbi:MAG: excinuclease ABC subunit C, partial [Methanobrevibacter sp.]|nr:excinuclease ABC subunit C [Candidatus Methanoflexus mossambicus]